MNRKNSAEFEIHSSSMVSYNLVGSKSSAIADSHSSLCVAFHIGSFFGIGNCSSSAVSPQLASHATPCCPSFFSCAEKPLKALQVLYKARLNRLTSSIHIQTYDARSFCWNRARIFG